jgi:hypothetical protein
MFSTGGLPPGSSSANACPGFEFVRLPRVQGPDHSRTRHDCDEMAQRASARRNHDLAGHHRRGLRTPRFRTTVGRCFGGDELGNEDPLARRYLLRGGSIDAVYKERRSRHLPSRRLAEPPTVSCGLNAIWTRSNPPAGRGRSSTVPDIIGNAVVVPISPQGVAMAVSGPTRQISSLFSR